MIPKQVYDYHMRTIKQRSAKHYVWTGEVIQNNNTITLILIPSNG